MAISRGCVIVRWPETSSKATCSLSKIQKSSTGLASPRSNAAGMIPSDTDGLLTASIARRPERQGNTGGRGVVQVAHALGRDLPGGPLQRRAVALEDLR